MALESEILLDYIRYARWAAASTLEACAELTTDELRTDMHTTYPSVWATLVHIYQADATWWSRFRNQQVSSLSTFDPGSDLAALSERWLNVLDELEAFAASRSPEDWQSTLHYQTGRGGIFAQPLWQAFLHMVNHSTLHRGQVLVMFRQLNRVPTSVDLIHYYRRPRTGNG